jgi:hypothetical protein
VPTGVAVRSDDGNLVPGSERHRQVALFAVDDGRYGSFGEP